MYKIQKLSETNFSAQALNFLSKKEIFYVGLTERILNKEDCVYLIINSDRIYGIFSYTKNRTFCAYIPVFNIMITSLLKSFFKKNSIFSIVGEKFCAEKIENIYKAATKKVPSEKRFMQTMVFDSAEKNTATQNQILCTPQDEELLFPLQLSYIKEEVLCPWHKINPAAERLSLAQALKKRIIVAVKKDGIFIAKAQSNAESIKYIQIGGVYTDLKFRNQGYAQKAVSFLCSQILQHNKTPVLFVKKKNKPAVRCYQKAGFKYAGEYILAYYKN